MYPLSTAILLVVLFTALIFRLALSDIVCNAPQPTELTKKDNVKDKFFESKLDILPNR